MREIDLVYRTMFAELGQRCLDAQFVRDFRIGGVDAAFPIEGSFFRTSVKGREYRYHQSSAAAGRRRKVYVGPASDPEITERVEEFARIKDDLRGRRKLVSTLTDQRDPDRLGPAGLEFLNPCDGHRVSPFLEQNANKCAAGPRRGKLTKYGKFVGWGGLWTTVLVHCRGVLFLPCLTRP